MDTGRLEFKCEGMNDGGKFPLENTGRGRDVSPAFTIENLSPRAKSLMIVLEDLSHPIKNFTHWVIWNIPAMDRIPAEIAPGKAAAALNGALQGIGYGMHRYAGPKPPKGKTHKYRFSIYALDRDLNAGPLSTKKRVLDKAANHIIQRGSICGYFE